MKGEGEEWTEIRAGRREEGGGKKELEEGRKGTKGLWMLLACGAGGTASLSELKVRYHG